MLGSWREELAWSAGFFDGEGCTSGRPNSRKDSSRRSLQMTIAQTDREVLDRFHAAVLGRGTVRGPYQRNGNRKPYWVWHSNSMVSAQAVVAMLWPFLGSIKKAQYKRCIAASGGIKVDVGQREYCPNGHFYGGSNVLKERQKGGYRRRCRICKNEQYVRWKENRYDEAPTSSQQQGIAPDQTGQDPDSGSSDGQTAPEGPSGVGCEIQSGEGDLP